MKLFFVLLFTVACNFYFEAATKETLEIFDIISSLEYSHSYPFSNIFQSLNHESKNVDFVELLKIQHVIEEYHMEGRILL